MLQAQHASVAGGHHPRFTASVPHPPDRVHSSNVERRRELSPRAAEPDARCGRCHAVCCAAPRRRPAPRGAAARRVLCQWPLVLCDCLRGCRTPRPSEPRCAPAPRHPLPPATAIAQVLPRLGGCREVPLQGSSPYVQPASILYELDGAAGVLPSCRELAIVWLGCLQASLSAAFGRLPLLACKNTATRNEQPLSRRHWRQPCTARGRPGPRRRPRVHHSTCAHPPPPAPPYP